MSSLAMSAGLVNQNDTIDNISNSENVIQRKRYNHNKTQKMNSSQTFNVNKVNQVLKTIQNDISNDGVSLGNFKPYTPESHLPPDDDTMNMNAVNVNGPNISRAPKTSNTNEQPMNPYETYYGTKEGFHNQTQNSNSNLSNVEHINNSGNPEPLQTNDMDLQSLNNAFMNDDAVRDYYNKLMPGGKFDIKKPKYNPSRTRDYELSNSTMYDSNSNNKVLMDKINYMINLLEEQQDEKTNNVTEEVVLFSFLGIFIIFVIDSFVRVGKYVR